MNFKNYFSTLSCKIKCIRLIINMINKKVYFKLCIFILLGACTAPTAMLGPAYTLGSSGNVMQAGFSYGSGEMIKKYTGKSTIENLQELTLKENNIKKNTLESEEFYILVDKIIKKTNGVLNISN